MYLASYGIIPTNQWQHKSDLQDISGRTVAMYLAYNKQQIPQSWFHKPELQNKDGWTVALILTHQKIIPSQEWYHDKMLCTLTGLTVQFILHFEKIQIPDQWKFGNKYGQTKAIEQAINCKIPDKQNYHNPNIKDFYMSTVCFYLFNSEIEIPDEWKDEQYKNPKKFKQLHITKAMEEAYNGIIPNANNYHDPNIKDQNGHTVCYFLWDKSIKIPRCWQDDQYKNPEKDENGLTKALKEILFYGKIPSKQNYYDPNLGIEYSNSVKTYLKINNLPIPNQWYDNSMKDLEKNPEFIQQAIYGEIPKKPNNIDSRYQNCQGWTVAMILARQGKQIPNEWKHNKLLTNYYDSTVAICYAQNGTIPPKEWMHDIEAENDLNESILSLLEKRNYIYFKKQFVINSQVKTTKTTCQYCNQTKKYQFIITKCQNNICLDCFINLCKKNQILQCPVCKQSDWFEPINIEQYKEYKKYIRKNYSVYDKSYNTKDDLDKLKEYIHQQYD